MKKIAQLFFLLLPVIALAQSDSVQSNVYTWIKPQQLVTKNIFSTKVFEGKAYNMEYVQFSCNTLTTAAKETTLHVPSNEEQLLILKSGILTIAINDSSWTMGPGSIALLLPGQKYSVQSTGTGYCDYYMMKYCSIFPVDISRPKTAGGSFVKDWNTISFKPHDKGGIRNYFERATAMCKRMEMHVSTLNEGLKSHDPHTHPAQEIVVVISGKTEMQIADKFYKGGPGSIYFLGSNISHAIRNDGMGPCMYFAFQFE